MSFHGCNGTRVVTSLRRFQVGQGGGVLCHGPSARRRVSRFLDSPRRNRIQVPPGTTTFEFYSDPGWRTHTCSSGREVCDLSYRLAQWPPDVRTCSERDGVVLPVHVPLSHHESDSCLF